MISVIDHIKYLISEYDCVIIPGWGALIAQYNNGYICEDMVYPPSRVISFNSDINNNDGLLANSLVRREGISYDMALTLIAEEVSAYKIQLNNGGEIALANIGIFEKNGNDSIGFIPFNDGKIRSDLYGFSVFNMAKLSDRIAEESESEKKSKGNIIYIPISRNFFKIAASVVLLIALSLLLSTPITVNNIQNYASMGIVNNNSVDAIIDNVDNSLVQQQEVVTIQEQQESIDDPVAEVEAEAVATTADYKYYLVVGSFSTKEAANKHISQYNNKVSELKLLHNGYKYMVYAAKEDSFSAIKPTYNNILSSFSDAWIYKFKSISF